MTAQGLSANRHSQFTYVAFNTSNIDQRWLWQLNIIPNCNKLAPILPIYISEHICVSCVCVYRLYIYVSLSSIIFTSCSPLSLIYNGESEAVDKGGE